jgi:hypothetical protein
MTGSSAYTSVGGAIGCGAVGARTTSVVVVDVVVVEGGLVVMGASDVIGAAVVVGVVVGDRAGLVVGGAAVVVGAVAGASVPGGGASASAADSPPVPLHAVSHSAPAAINAVVVRGCDRRSRGSCVRTDIASIMSGSHRHR